MDERIKDILKVCERTSLMFVEARYRGELEDAEVASSCLKDMASIFQNSADQCDIIINGGW